MEIRTKTIQRLRDALLQSGGRKSAVTSSAYRTLIKQGLLSDAEKQAVERVGPVAEAMFLVMAADEQITDTELAALRGAVRGLTGDLLSDDIVQIMMEGYALQLREEGREKRLKAIAEATVESGEAMNTFALAAAVALADDQLHESESAVIKELQGIFQLGDEEVKTVLGELADDAS